MCKKCKKCDTPLKPYKEVYPEKELDSYDERTRSCTCPKCKDKKMQCGDCV